jgi:hypothetical protein
MFPTEVSAIDATTSKNHGSILHSFFSFNSVHSTQYEGGAGGYDCGAREFHGGFARREFFNSLPRERSAPQRA